MIGQLYFRARVGLRAQILLERARGGNRDSLERVLRFMSDEGMARVGEFTIETLRALIDEAVADELLWLADQIVKNTHEPALVDMILEDAHRLLARFPHFEPGFVQNSKAYRERYVLEADPETMEVERGDEH